MLSWKIRTGFNKNNSTKRIKTNTNWFFKNHLVPHFEMEENHIFSILDDNNELIKQALADHRQLSRLFAETEDNAKTLSKIEEELEQHIRFEELVLFTEIQKLPQKNN